MQGAIQAIRYHGNILKQVVVQHMRVVDPITRSAIFSRFKSVSPALLEEHGFESTTILDILKAKGKGADGSWLWCTTDDTVYDAVKSVCLCFWSLELFFLSCEYLVGWTLCQFNFNFTFRLPLVICWWLRSLCYTTLWGNRTYMTSAY